MTSPSIEIRVDVGGNDGVPHTFIIVNNGNGFVKGYGFAPKESHSPMGDGWIYDDTNHEWQHSTGKIDITPEQYNRLVSYINDSIENPPYYDIVTSPFVGVQCTKWVTKGLNVAGIDTPLNGPWHNTWNPYGQRIVLAVADFFRQGRTPRRDPLAFDLDGDGIETIGASEASAVLFDHNGDGRLTGSGWVKPDDGFLALDRNGNGKIDNGGELFGVDTLLPNGHYASTGFEALSGVDTNSDGVINSNDAYFSSLRVWRDLNQDGVSQADELQSLASLGIASINIKAQNDRVDLGNGNVRTATGSFQRTDGTTGSAYNLELQDNPFFRRFADPAPITERAKALPEMAGSGVVYDMRQAASVSDTFANKLEQFASLTDRRSMRANMTSLLYEWYSATPKEISEPWTKYGLSDTRHSWIPGIAVDLHFAGVPDPVFYSNGSTYVDPEWARRAFILITLEHFTGQKVLRAPPPNTSSGTSNGATYTMGSGGGGGSGAVANSEPTLDAYLSQQQWDLFQQSYDALTGSVYDALLPQTLLKPYLDLIDLKIESTGIHFDFSKVDAALASKHQSDEAVALMDLLDLNRIMGKNLWSMGWQGADQLEAWLAQAVGKPDLVAQLQDCGYIFANSNGANATASVIVRASTEADNITGGNQSDFLFGQAGNDTIDGGGGNDLIVGGQGDDSLTGGAGSDTFLFGLGDGRDTISGNDFGTGKSDVLQLRGNLSPAGMTLRRVGDDLLLSTLDGLDAVTVQRFFVGDAAMSPIDRIQFNDGTVWDTDQIKQLVQVPTIGDDTLYGYAGNDSLTGAAGNDTLYGYGGNDVLRGEAGCDSIYGGAGADTLMAGAGRDNLSGEAGDDLLQGDAGNDSLSGGAGNDTLDGGAGNDTLDGGDGSDVYLLGRGSGQDTITAFDNSTGRVDAIQLAADVGTNEVTVRRSGDQLVVAIKGTRDSITVSSFFSQDGSSGYRIDQVKFADGTVWDVATIKNKVNVPTSSSDSLAGYAGDDNLYGSDGNDSLYGYSGQDTLDGGAGADSLYGGAGDDQLSGGLNNDWLQADVGNDRLFGGEGNDTLYGETGNDTLDGGAGNDMLDGGAGSDVYVFGRGYGQDEITSYDTSAGRCDVIQLAEGISASDTILTRNGDTLQIALKGTNDKLKVTSFFQLDGNGAYRIDQLKFVDGTVWDVNTIKTMVTVSTPYNDSLSGYATDDVLSGADGNDSLYGFNGQDTLYGGNGVDSLSGGGGDDLLYGGQNSDVLDGDAGNDRLFGETGADTVRGGLGNDTLDGGSGNDSLDGGDGSDTYVFGRGYGMDTITSYDASAGRVDTVSFAPDVAVGDVTVTRYGDNLVLTLKGTGDSLTVNYFFQQNGSSPYRIDQVKFNDGTTWDINAIKSQVVASSTIAGQAIGGTSSNDSLVGGAGNDSLTGLSGDDVLRGGDGNDLLMGNDGNDTLEGGKGDDLLYGFQGNDLFLFNRGDGSDRITGGGDVAGKTDTLRFGADIRPEQVLASRNGDHLVLAVAGTADQVVVEYYFTNDTQNLYQVERIEFADGTLWDAARVKALVTTTTDGDDSLVGYNSANNLFNGAGGFDTLAGGLLSDTLDGGLGEDRLYGNAGNDVLLGGEQRDSLYGGDGQDELQGGDDCDVLNGNAGDDLLIGGSGDDTLDGGYGNDVYQFNIGDGSDRISSYDPTAGKTDVLRFGSGIEAKDIRLSRSGDDLVVARSASNDQVLIASFFMKDGLGEYRVDRIEFADGTNWDVAAIKAKVTGYTDGDDNLVGYNDVANSLVGGLGFDSLAGGGLNDTLDGGAGDDRLLGNAGNDLLLGGDQRDVLYGGADNDELRGGEDNDSLYGDAGNDILIGGAGDDLLNGGSANDIYIFGVGDGNDTISNYDTTSGKIDILRFGEGIVSSDLVLTRDQDNLIVSRKDSSDRILVSNYFYGDATGGYQIERIEFADGLSWDVSAVKAKVTAATNGDDSLVGYGNVANELFGSDGLDTLNGGALNDTLSGGADDDTIDGRAGNDLLDGGDQNDTLYGGDGNDTLVGGSGNDYLNGGLGTNIYRFSRGFGNDRIQNYVYSGPRTDIVEFDQTISAGEIYLSRKNSDLIAMVIGASDVLTVPNFFGSDGVNPGYRIDQFRFADGTTWDTAALLGKVLAGHNWSDSLTGYSSDDTLLGGMGNDWIIGMAGNDRLEGQAGNDQVSGGMGNDVLLGQSGNDYLMGDSGDDTLDGGAGNDTLTGGEGSDVYFFGLGSGSDAIFANDGAVAGVDVLSFVDSLSADQLWFRRSGDDLEVSIIGTADKVRVSGWYYGSQNHVEQFKTADGKVLLDSQVQNLVNAMASFAPPSAGQTTLSQSYQDALASVIAANWH